MPEIKGISFFGTAAEIVANTLLLISNPDTSATSGYSTFTTSASELALAILDTFEYTTELSTTDKTIIGAINEIAQGGGGGSVLYGTTAPTSQQGTNGSLYIQYSGSAQQANLAIVAFYGKIENTWLSIATGGGISSDIIGEEYDPTATYNIGDYCVHENKLYVCTTDGTTGAWNASHWDETNVAYELKLRKDDFDYLNEFKFNVTDAADFYDDTSTYKKGDYVIDNSILYKAKVDINTPESFTSAHWEDIMICDDIKSLNDSRLDDLPVVTMPYSAVATFNTDRAVPLADVSCQIVAQQSGSGDPSPSNIRSISGFSSVVVSHSGEDTSTHTDITIPLGSTVYGGTLDVDNGILTVTHARVDMGTLTYSSASSGAARFTASLPESVLAPASANDKADLICDTYPTSSSIDIYNGTVDGRVAVHTSGAFWVRDTNYSTTEAIKAALSGHYIVYRLATPKVIPLNLWGTVALSSLSWQLAESSSSETHKVFYAVLTGKANGQTNIISGDYSITTASLANMPDKTIRGYTSAATIAICDNSCATVEAFVATMTGKTVAYELASPTSSTCLYEPTELVANNGSNSLWADTGDTSVAYRESAQKYIDENTGLSRAKVYSLNLSQGGAWINTGVDVTNVDTLMFERDDNSDVNLQVVIKKSQIAVYTGGADVYTTIYAQGGKPLNVRIYNNILYASYNGTGAATYVTNVYALKDVF